MNREEMLEMKKSVERAERRGIGYGSLCTLYQRGFSKGYKKGRRVEREQQRSQNESK